MKIKMNHEYRKLFTLDDIDRAKAVIAYEHDDEMTAADWAGYAAREALRNTRDDVRAIIAASAETARNCRAWNLYGDDTGNMDVWIEFTAETWFGFLKGGAYLSDIWQTGAEHYAEHMYVRYYREAEL